MGGRKEGASSYDGEVKKISGNAFLECVRFALLAFAGRPLRERPPGVHYSPPTAQRGAVPA